MTSIKWLPLLILLFLATTVSAQESQAWEAIGYQRGNAAALSLAYAPDDDTIAAQYADGTMLVTEVTPENLTGAAFSPTGGLAFAQESELNLPDKLDSPVALDAPIRALTFNASGDMLAAAMEDGSLRILSSLTGEEQARLDGFEGVAAALRFDPVGRVLAAGNPRLNQVRLWNPSNPTEQVVLPGQYPYAFSDDGSLFAIKSDDQQISIRVVDEILEREEDEILIRLQGHNAPITDFAFLPDGDHLLSASQDASLSLWDIRSGAEVKIFSGHLAPITSLSLSPDGEHAASADARGAVIVWDVATGDILQRLAGTGAAITDVAFSADGGQLAATDRDGGLIRWGLGDAVDLPASSSADADPSAATDRLFEMGVIGDARLDLVGGVHPMAPVGCFIAENEKVLALARSPEGAFLVYAGSDSCEGQVWINAGVRSFDWDDVAALAALPIIQPDADTVPRLRLVDSEAICAAAGRTVTGSASGALALYPPDGLPADAQATVVDGVGAIICHEYSTTPIENCHRLGPNNFSYIFTRLRTDDMISVVDFQSGDVLARRRFEGQSPDLCPNRVARGEVFGDPAPSSEWVPWVLGETGHDALAPLRSMLTGSRRAYFAADDASDTLAQYNEATPIHPLGRAGDDWLLALLPDMSIGWVPLADVDLSAGVALADLPDTSDADARPAFVAERADQLAQFPHFRPLGRFHIPADYTVVSHEGFFIASVQTVRVDVADAAEPVEIPTLSMWDIRGGQQLWSLSLPDRVVDGMRFSPQDNRLLVQTTAKISAALRDIPPEELVTMSSEQIAALLATDEDVDIGDIPEEIRFTFFDVQTGQIIGETGDVDIIEMPVIPGNMPQFLNASPHFTEDESKVIVNYWRRAEASRCAVWDVTSAQIVWQMEASCGLVNETGQFLAIREPHEEIFSAYDRLVIFETDSGARVLESPYEAAGAKWLDAENLIIDRPYGEPPIIWNIIDNSVAVLEWPRPLPNFQFEPLNQTMLLADGEETFVWDIPTGELLGSTALQGRLIELPNQVIVLQEVEVQRNDERQLFLRAVNLGNGDVLWEIPWEPRELTLRDDGLYGFSLNYETGIVDVLDMQTGQIVGEVRVPELSFALTEDWNWLTFSGSAYHVVWGLEENAALFDDTPHIRTTAEVPVYFEANTQFPTEFFLPTDSYLWLSQRSTDGQWLLLDNSGGTNYWIPAEDVEALRDIESLPIYDPL